MTCHTSPRPHRSKQSLAFLISLRFHPLYYLARTVSLIFAQAAYQIFLPAAAPASLTVSQSLIFPHKVRHLKQAALVVPER